MRFSGSIISSFETRSCICFVCWLLCLPVGFGNVYDAVAIRVLRWLRDDPVKFVACLSLHRKCGQIPGAGRPSSARSTECNVLGGIYTGTVAAPSESTCITREGEMSEKGEYPKTISYTSTPHAHQSTPKPYPCPAISSGARYSRVPQSVYVLSFSMRLAMPKSTSLRAWQQ